MNPPTSQPDLRNAYTDAPDLHPNLILGSLHLLFWLFFHPSAWRNYVKRIDPGLRADFCLAELERNQIANPELRRLRIRVYVILPLLVILLLFIGDFSSLYESFRETELFIGYTFRSSSLFIGIALTISFCTIIGTSISLQSSLIWLGGILIISTALTYNVSLLLLVLFATLSTIVTIGLASHKVSYTFLRLFSGIISGLLFGTVVFVVAGLLAGGLPPDKFEEWGYTSILFGIVLGLMTGWRTRKWNLSLILIVIVFAMTMIPSTTLIHNMMMYLGSIEEEEISKWITQITILVGVYLAQGLIFGVIFGFLFAFPYLLAYRVAGPLAAAIAGALPIALLFSFSDSSIAFNVLLGLTFPLWRPILLYPLLAAYNFALLRLDERRAPDRPPLLRRHSAFWDEHQRLPLLGLEEHVVLIAERSPAEGRAAIEYLAASRQRWAAQSAQIELDARRLERCADVEAIGGTQRELAAGELEGPTSALLRSFSRISQDTEAALRQESAYNQRLALTAVEDRLDGLLRELTRSSDRYAARFRPVANRWREIIAARVGELARAVEQRQEIDSPYVIGVPLTERQEIFVGRADVSARIEQLLLDRRRPPLLLYGQRRMGKTSLLNNLGRLLPSTIVPLFVDLQGPASQASDHAGLLYNIARGMADSAQRQRDLALPALSREALASDPFTRFDEWLDEVERALGQSAALLALDEFEALDGAIARGRFDEQDVLGMLRHLIQHRPRFKVLLAGSHTLDELERWAGYLINVQVVRIGYLSRDEARQLVEHPVEGFALRYEPDAGRRVLDLTRGHPFLVQLLCAEIVALKNEQPIAARRLARLDDVATAVPEALRSGSFFFADIQRNQVDPDGLALLRVIAARGEGALVGRDTLAGVCSGDLDRALDLLARRELIEAVDGGYRFQVELIRRWFAG